MVYLGANAVATQEGVYLESKVEGSASCWQGFNFALWGEDKYFAGKEVQLDGVEKVHGIGLWVVKNFLDGAQPVVQFAVVVNQFVALFILPVCGKALFGHLVHVVRTYLHLYPFALLRHQRYVQGVVYPVAQTVGVRLIYLANGHIYLETFVYLFLSHLGGVDDAHGQDVVYLFKGYVLVLHLVPDAIGAFHACLQCIFNAYLVERLANGACKLVEQGVALCLCRGQFCFDGSILFRMLIAEAEVFKLGFNFI